MKDIKLLDLNEKDLEKALAKIIEESPKAAKDWTEKETQIATRLKKAGVPHRVIAEKLGRSVKSIENRLYKATQ